MEIKDVVDAWKKDELSGDAAMCVIHDLLYPAAITEEDIKWAKKGLKKSKVLPSEKLRKRILNGQKKSLKRRLKNWLSPKSKNLIEG